MCSTEKATTRRGSTVFLFNFSTLSLFEKLSNLWVTQQSYITGLCDLQADPPEISMWSYLRVSLQTGWPSGLLYEL